jgi:hypothetical protein
MFVSMLFCFYIFFLFNLCVYRFVSGVLNSNSFSLFFACELSKVWKLMKVTLFSRN